MATDFSDASLDALDRAQAIVGSQLVVLHVTDDRPVRRIGRQLEQLRFLAPFNESHTVPVEHIVTAGEAGQVIAEQADRLHADLIVLGSPIDELRDEDFETSTVLQVISNVSCPVLCVPSARDASVASVAEMSSLWQIRHGTIQTLAGGSAALALFVPVAEDVVKQRHCRLDLLDGGSVELETTVQVIFQLQ